MNLSEYEFYKNQLRKMKANDAKSMAVSVEFLDLVLNKPEDLNVLQMAYAAYMKAK